MLTENQSGQVRSTCHSLRKSDKSSVFSGKNAGKFSMPNTNPNPGLGLGFRVRSETSSVITESPILMQPSRFLRENFRMHVRT